MFDWFLGLFFPKSLLSAMNKARSRDKRIDLSRVDLVISKDGAKSGAYTAKAMVSPDSRGWTYSGELNTAIFSFGKFTTLEGVIGRLGEEVFIAGGEFRNTLFVLIPLSCAKAKIFDFDKREWSDDFPVRWSCKKCGVQKKIFGIQALEIGNPLCTVCGAAMIEITPQDLTNYVP